MKKYLAFALFGIALAGGATESNAQGCCIDVPKVCYPVLRIPVEKYIYAPALFSPPDRPVPYSVWYYSFYQPFCAGKSEAECIWACAPAPVSYVSVRAAF